MNEEGKKREGRIPWMVWDFGNRATLDKRLLQIKVWQKKVLLKYFRWRWWGSLLLVLRTFDPLLSPPIDTSRNFTAHVSGEGVFGLHYSNLQSLWVIFNPWVPSLCCWAVHCPMKDLISYSFVKIYFTNRELALLPNPVVLNNKFQPVLIRDTCFLHQ